MDAKGFISAKYCLSVNRPLGLDAVLSSVIGQG